MDESVFQLFERIEKLKANRVAERVYEKERERDKLHSRWSSDSTNEKDIFSE